MESKQLSNLSQKTRQGAQKDGSPGAIAPQTGATMLEYMLMALLVLLVCVTVVALIGESTSQTFSLVGSGGFGG